MNYNYESLKEMSKGMLLDLLKEETELAAEGDEDEQYTAFENIEQIVYVIRNCVKE